MANTRDTEILLQMLRDTRDSLTEEIKSGLENVSEHLEKLNGRAETNATAIAILQNDMKSACSRVEDVEVTVHEIQRKGCLPGRQLDEILKRKLTHRADGTIEVGGRTVTKRDVAIGGGAVGVGMIVLKLLEYGNDALHHFLRWP